MDFSGSVRTVLGKFGKEQCTDLRNDDSHLEIQATHDFTNGLRALAGLGICFDRDVEGNESHNNFSHLTTNKLYAGFSYEGIGQLTFGKQLTISNEIELSDYTYNLGSVNQLIIKGDKIIHFKSADFSGFCFGTDCIFDESPAKQEAKW